MVSPHSVDAMAGQIFRLSVEVEETRREAESLLAEFICGRDYDGAQACLDGLRSLSEVSFDCGVMCARLEDMRDAAAEVSW